MKVKKYEAPTMQKALAEVKKDLGSDAVILHTKTRKKSGIFGFWGKEVVEITASSDVKLMEKKVVPNTGKLLKYYQKTLAQEKLVENQEQVASSDIKLLHSDLDEVKRLVSSLIKRSKHSDVSGLSDELLEAYLMLIEQEVCEEISKDIVHRIQSQLSDDELSNKAVVCNTLKSIIVDMIPTVQPINISNNQHVKKVAFVGPTGVGKTTTIAKLAADFSLRKQLDVALITIDTYRIAAVEQLRTYADIISIPLEVVLTPDDVKRALEKHKHRDLVLIDTAGRSHKNKLQMAELKAFIDAISPDETHLVLSTTSNYNNISDIIERFKVFAVDKVLFTKLDEAVSFGLVINVMKKLNTSLSYITTGQNVPDDISITDPQFIADLIVEADK